MSPVNRAGSVSEISPRQSFLSKNIDMFKNIDEGPGWKFSHMNTPARWPGRNIFDKIASLSPDSGQNGIILVLYVFPLQEYAK